jgi:hypothetical protein
MNISLTTLQMRLLSWLAGLDHRLRTLLRLEQSGDFFVVLREATTRRVRTLVSPAGYRIFMAGHLERKGDLAGALAAWGRISNAAPHLKTSTIQRLKLKMARQAGRDRHWGAAVTLYSDLLELSPDDDRFRKGLASSSGYAARDAQSLGEWTEAIGYWRTNLNYSEHDHARSYAMQSLVVCAMRCASDAEGRRQFEDALGCWRTLLSVKPGSLIALEGIERCTRMLSNAA